METVKAEKTNANRQSRHLNSIYVSVVYYQKGYEEFTVTLTIIIRIEKDLLKITNEIN